MVHVGQLEEAALFEITLLMGWFQENGMPIHPNMAQLYEHLSAKLGVEQL